jgi:hypothetical protein
MFRRIMMAGAIVGVALTLGSRVAPAEAQAYLAQYYSPYYPPYYAPPYYRYGYPVYRGGYRSRWYRGGSRSGDHYGGVDHNGAQ